jgi:hypothetical protein
MRAQVGARQHVDLTLHHPDLRSRSDETPSDYRTLDSCESDRRCVLRFLDRQEWIAMTARESAAVERAAQDVFEHGKSQAEAARTHDISYSSLTRALRRRGIPPLGPNRSSQGSPSLELSAQANRLESPTPQLSQPSSPIEDSTENANGTTWVSRPPRARAATFNHEQVPREKEKPQRITPLLRFIRELNEYPLELESFVSALERPSGKKRTGVYLYQLAAQPYPNPTLRLAKAIVDQSSIYGAKFQIESLTYEELLIGSADGEV